MTRAKMFENTTEAILRSERRGCLVILLSAPTLLTPARKRALTQELENLRLLDQNQKGIDAASPRSKTSTVGVMCPHCGCPNVKANGSAQGWARFKCKDITCARTFNARTGTSMAHLRKSQLHEKDTANALAAVLLKQAGAQQRAERVRARTIARQDRERRREEKRVAKERRAAATLACAAVRDEARRVKALEKAMNRDAMAAEKAAAKALATEFFKQVLTGNGLPSSTAHPGASGTMVSPEKIRASNLAQAARLSRALSNAKTIKDPADDGGVDGDGGPTPRRAHRTGLMLAAEAGKVNVIECLLPQVDPLIKDEGGKTALMIAAQNGRIGALKALAPHSDIEARDTHGQTALCLAIVANQHDSVELLFQLSDLSGFQRKGSNEARARRFARTARYDSIVALIEGRLD